MRGIEIFRVMENSIYRDSFKDLLPEGNQDPFFELGGIPVIEVWVVESLLY